MNEKDLDQILEKWEIDLPEEPHFRSAVWREIAIRDTAPSCSRFREALDNLLAPRLAVPIAAIAAITVMLTATFHGEQSNQRVWKELAAAYSSAIDPLAHTKMLATMTEPQP